MTLPYCKQVELTDCGAASVEMVALAKGKTVTQVQLRDWLGIPQVGYTSKPALRAVFHRLQIPFQEYAAQTPESDSRISLLTPQESIDYIVEALEQGQLVLANYLADDGEGHYGVLHRYHQGKIILHDPYYGPDIAHSPAAFMERWLSEDHKWKCWRLVIENS